MSAEQNPYEPPRATGFQEELPEISQLEQRVAELERRLAASWFLRPSLLPRTFAVCGYLLLGYVVFMAVVFPIMFLMDWLFR